jgi:hypothetical protein
MIMKKILVFILAAATSLFAQGQIEEALFKESIQTALLHPSGNQMGLPVIKLGATAQLELHFDDLDGDYKNYYYTYQLCNADWTPAQLSYFDYVKGYTNNRINTFRLSNLARQRYTHYEAYLPEKNCMPTRSGNYILRVSLDGDTSRTVFIRRFMIVEEKVTIGSQVVQPFNTNFYRSHQRMSIRINAQSLNVTNPQMQLKAVVMQNNRWDNALRNMPPTFIRGKEIEYNNDNELLFESGREWRWLDLRSFRFWSDRIQRIDVNNGKNDIIVKPDAPRSGIRYSYYQDLNGLFSIENSDRNNPNWQSDYGTTHFRFAPPGGQPYLNKDLYLIARFTRYGQAPFAKMSFNDTTGMYETKVFLKQGFYSYQYVLVDRKDKKINLTETEGNYWETENTYQVLLYYRQLGGRTDELVGFSTISSFNGRVGPGF